MKRTDLLKYLRRQGCEMIREGRRHSSWRGSRGEQASVDPPFHGTGRAHKRNERSSPLLQNRLVLHRFVCRQFGYDDLGGMLERLLGVPAEIGAGGASEYAQALYLNPDLASLNHDQLEQYDANIVAHSVRLRMTGEHGRTWKPHQYLALLFTEHYLRRYFGDSAGLDVFAPVEIIDLNKLAEKKGIKRVAVGDFGDDNLAKPLWVFLGKTVRGSSKSKADQATRFDVIQILNFLGWALAHGGQARSMIRGLLNGQSGLLDEAGRDYYRRAFLLPGRRGY